MSQEIVFPGTSTGERDEQKIILCSRRSVKGINDYLNGRLLNADEAFLPSMLRLMRGNYILNNPRA
jgi:hypothetical protein